MDRRRFVYGLAAAGSMGLVGGIGGIVSAQEAATAAAGAAARWSYRGENGPDYWGELSEEWQTCKTGLYQSPINLVDSEFVPIPDWIGIRYERTPINMTHIGWTVRFNTPPGSQMAIRDTIWELRYFQFHSPSEHTVDGRPYAMEIQFVHEKQDEPGRMAILSVLMALNITDNPNLAKLFTVMPTAPGLSFTEGALFNPRSLIPSDRGSWRYYGSLTVPPCTEAVLWMVMSEIIPLSARQLRQYRQAISGRSNRPIQPLNTRFLLRAE